MTDQASQTTFSQAIDHESLKTLYAKAQAHSHFTKMLRFLIPALIPATIGVLVLFVSLRLLDSPALEPLTGNARETGVQMISPVFSGTSTGGIPYRLRAKSAMRDGHNASIVTLESPILVMENGVTASANSGRYDSQRNTLTLQNDVKVGHPDSYVFTSALTVIDIDAQLADGDQKILGTGPMGSITSDRYQIDEAGRKVDFAGNTRTILNPSYSSRRSQDQHSAENSAKIPAEQEKSGSNLVDRQSDSTESSLEADE